MGRQAKLYLDQAGRLGQRGACTREIARQSQSLLEKRRESHVWGYQLDCCGLVVVVQLCRTRRTARNRNHRAENKTCKSEQACKSEGRACRAAQRDATGVSSHVNRTTMPHVKPPNMSIPGFGWTISRDEARRDACNLATERRAQRAPGSPGARFRSSRVFPESTHANSAMIPGRSK